MELRPITADDLDLYVGMLTDPAMMTELGGPLPADGLEDKLRALAADAAADRIWYFVIEEGGEAAGTICVWDHEDHGSPVTEIGWMVAPSFQGRGLASAALAEVLDRARADGRWPSIHAFPGVTNAASNALCRRAGFTLEGERDFSFRGRPLRCNHWSLLLR